MKKTKFFGALTLFSFIGQVAWVVENMYFNVFIYKMFHASSDAISLMVALSAVAATVTTLFVGAFSDRIGRRKPFLTYGYLLWGLVIATFALLRPSWLSPTAGVVLVIVMDCVMTFFGSSANDACFNAWLTEACPEAIRGRAEGINAMMPLLAILAVFGGFMGINPEDPNGWSIIFLVIGAVVAVSGLWGLPLLDEPGVKHEENGSALKNLAYCFRVSVIKENKRLYWILGAFAVFGISIQVFMPYLILYYTESLGLADYVLIMAPAIVLAAIATAFYGRMFDARGFKQSLWPTLVLLALGYAVLFLFRGTPAVFIGSLLMMTGYLTGMSVFGAAIRTGIPANKAGAFQGIRLIAQVLIPGVIGPVIGALVLKNAETVINQDGTASFIPHAGIFLAALIALLPLIAVFFLVKDPKREKVKKAEPVSGPLLTARGEAISDQPWQSYPRPQLVRDSFFCLNGLWQFGISKSDTKRLNSEILVPFAPETVLSRVNKRIEKDDVLHYQTTFTLPEGFVKDRVLLHFDAVDQQADIYVNGLKMARHTGGYEHFTVDITPALLETNTLYVRVKDPLDLSLPHGKQSKKPGGMWYTPTSGIWQTVWLESVNIPYVEDLRINADDTGVTVTALGITDGELTVDTPEGPFTTPLTDGTASVDFRSPRLWSPEDPYLYHFTVTTGTDTVKSYFALRTVTVEPVEGIPRLCLNGEPYFFNGLLDQGYWSDGGPTPPAPESYAEDLLRIKRMGFNTVRKHLKVEPERFYYDCDCLGILVFQDMVNNGRYRFIRDSLLPTLGFRRAGDKYRNRNKETRRIFTEAMLTTVGQLKNHPSIALWTIFNEGWGQFTGSELYDLLRTRDDSRPIDTASGWFRGCKTDVVSLHTYFGRLRVKKSDKPVLVTECGGYALAVPEHTNTKKLYGYKKFRDGDKWNAAIARLYETQVRPLISKGLCGVIYTQLSDVEEEVNGLLTADRRAEKADKTLLNPVFAELQKEIRK